MYDTVKAKHIDSYNIELTFADGIVGIVDFSEYTKKPGIFSSLKDKNFFMNFNINKDIGNICLENELDISPETLYYKITNKKPQYWTD